MEAGAIKPVFGDKTEKKRICLTIIRFLIRRDVFCRGNSTKKMRLKARKYDVFVTKQLKKSLRCIIIYSM